MDPQIGPLSQWTSEYSHLSQWLTNCDTLSAMMTAIISDLLRVFWILHPHIFVFVRILQKKKLTQNE